METIHQCLDSIYAQSMQPDKVVLWLAEEQFPNREKDLPDRLLEDLDAGRIEVFWCDDLGSHKKYFYTMQKYPEDIIVTLDDDNIYSPDTLEKLFESYKKFPKAISAHRCSLILFDNQGELLPCSRWVLPCELILDEPSLQLMPIGSQGILYPPGIFNKAVFNKKAIKDLCSYNSTVFFNDSWLKIHSLMNDIPIVALGESSNAQKIKKAQQVALKKSHSYARELGKKEYSIWREVLSDPTYSKLLSAKFSEMKKAESFVSDEDDAVLENIRRRFRFLVSHNEMSANVIKQTIQHSLMEINRQRALGLSAEKLNNYIKQYQLILCELPNLCTLKKDSLSIRALMDYGAILSSILSGSNYCSPETYKRMHISWKAFLFSHPFCELDYKKGYVKFLKRLMQWKKQ